MTASNVGARTQAWQAKRAVFKIPGFVCKRFLPFLPHPLPAPLPTPSPPRMEFAFAVMAVGRVWTAVQNGAKMGITREEIKNLLKEAIEPLERKLDNLNNGFQELKRLVDFVND